METFRETQQYNPTDWREWLSHEINLPLPETNLLDKIAELISSEELERCFEDTVHSQQGRDAVRGIRPEPKPGFRINAMIQWAREKGVITMDEARRLEYKIASRV
jgi:hypothetical protein